MKLIYIILFISLFTFTSRGQRFPSEQWHRGNVTLNDHTIVSGMVKYDLERDVIMVEVGEKTETFSAQLVMKFSFNQHGDDRLRHFFTLPYLAPKGRKTLLKFFEVIIEGKMTLLAREYIEKITSGSGNSRYNNYSNYNYNPLNQTGRPYTRMVLSYRIFFLDHKGNMTLYSGRKKDVFEVLSESKQNLKKYVKSNRLKIDKLQDVAKLVAYYNTLI